MDSKFKEQLTKIFFITGKHGIMDLKFIVSFRETRI